MTKNDLDPYLYCIRCRQWVKATSREAMYARLVWVCKACRKGEE